MLFAVCILSFGLSAFFFVFLSSGKGALESFKNGSAMILIATDVAGRGIDVKVTLTLKP
jgi:hypothetical protein